MLTLNCYTDLSLFYFGDLLLLKSMINFIYWAKSAVITMLLGQWK